MYEHDYNAFECIGVYSNLRAKRYNTSSSASSMPSWLRAGLGSWLLSSNSAQAELYVRRQGVHMLMCGTLADCVNQQSLSVVRL
eukprot:scaffold12609_cov17-Prasinocladus_malaysianus.AAC.4